MNKTELVAAVAEQADISKKDAEKVLKAFVDVVTEEMKKGEKVQLVGFGTFEVSERAARNSPNVFVMPSFTNATILFGIVSSYSVKHT